MKLGFRNCVQFVQAQKLYIYHLTLRTMAKNYIKLASQNTTFVYSVNYPTYLLILTEKWLCGALVSSLVLVGHNYKNNCCFMQRQNIIRIIRGEKKRYSKLAPDMHLLASTNLKHANVPRFQNFALLEVKCNIHRIIVTLQACPQILLYTGKSFHRIQTNFIVAHANSRNQRMLPYNPTLNTSSSNVANAKKEGNKQRNKD